MTMGGANRMNCEICMYKIRVEGAMSYENRQVF
jgi:hypothetical protein